MVKQSSETGSAKAPRQPWDGLPALTMEGQKGKTMKKYLQAIKTGGAVAHIAYYADTPGKNYRVYYNGGDSGKRFEKLGNASRHLERVAALWRYNGAVTIERTYATAADIPRRGSNA